MFIERTYFIYFEGKMLGIVFFKKKKSHFVYFEEIMLGIVFF